MLDLEVLHFRPRRAKLVRCCGCQGEQCLEGLPPAEVSVAVRAFFAEHGSCHGAPEPLA